MGIELKVTTNEKPQDFSSWAQEEKDVFWMQQALHYARLAESENEIPVGAILVQNDNIIAAGWNQSIQHNDPTAHAEIQTLRAAGKQLQNYRLLDTTLYVTLEPCVMCAYAMVHARVSRLVYAASDLKTGAIDSVENILDLPMNNHLVSHASGVCAQESSELISNFFKRRRQEKKSAKNSNRSLA